MKEYRKKNYTMKAEKVAAGTELYNYLEDCHYVTTDDKCIKLIGTVGEEWPVTIEKLAKTYTFIDGTPITSENIPDGVFDIATIVGDDAETIFAEQSRFGLTPVGEKSSQPIVMAFLMATVILS